MTGMRDGRRPASGDAAAPAPERYEAMGNRKTADLPDFC